jgi:hypothetical protein
MAGGVWGEGEDGALEGLAKSGGWGRGRGEIQRQSREVIRKELRQREGYSDAVVRQHIE